jgi:transcriptional regulator with XRE-family HTH domain
MIDNQRIKIFREALNLSQGEFAEKLGMKQGSISDVERGKANVSRKLINLLQSNFNLNESWLIQGEGSMFDKGGQIATNAKTVADINYPIEQAETPFIELGDGQLLMVIPLVHEFAYAGYLTGYADPEYVQELPKHTIIVQKRHHGIYKAFEVIGDSMENASMPRDSIYDGMIVTGHQIQRHHWKNKLHTHRWKNWIVVHKEGIVIKRIKDQKVIDGTVTLESLNPNKELYPDREVHLDDVIELYSIVNKSEAL